MPAFILPDGPLHRHLAYLDNRPHAESPFRRPNQTALNAYLSVLDLVDGRRNLPRLSAAGQELLALLDMLLEQPAQVRAAMRGNPSDAPAPPPIGTVPGEPLAPRPAAVPPANTKRRPPAAA